MPTKTIAQLASELNDEDYPARDGKYTLRLLNFLARTFHRGSKLTVEEVYAIRSLFKLGDSDSSIAQEFHLTLNAVRNLRRGHTWSWLPDEENVIWNE